MFWYFVGQVLFHLKCKMYECFFLYIFRFAFLQISTTDDVPYVSLFGPTFFFFLTHSWIDFDKKKIVNANIMNKQIFHLNKYELKGH